MRLLDGPANPPYTAQLVLPREQVWPRFASRHEHIDIEVAGLNSYGYGARVLTLSALVDDLSPGVAQALELAHEHGVGPVRVCHTRDEATEALQWGRCTQCGTEGRMDVYVTAERQFCSWEHAHD